MSLSTGPSVNAIPAAQRSATVTHRTAVAAVDKCIVAAMTAADQAGTVGVMAAVEHKCAYSPGNIYGAGGASAIVAVTPTVNKTVDFTIAQVVGATYYDIFFSIDAAPLWVARVTEAQRAAGCAVTAVGTVGAGGSAGVVNVRLVGTGLATTSAPFTVNNAYIPTNATGISCRGYVKAIIHAALSVTDMRTLPTLKIYPFISKNDASPSTWYQGAVVDFAPGSAVGKSLYQTTTVDVYDSASLAVLVDTISGTGAAVTIYVELV